MRLIDADKLKAHYSWWNDDNRELFDQIVDAQPTVEQQEMTKLLPCPFCGCEAELFACPANGVAYIVCGNCLAKTKKFYADINCSAVDEAIKAWNRRVNNDTERKL